MEKRRNDKELIDLSKENVSDGIYIYDFDKEKNLDSVLMGQVYRQAFKAIGKIVGDFSGRKRRHDKCGMDHDSSCNRVYSKRNVLTNYSNIIPLIGGRGTGKTSVLQTIVQYLGKKGEETRNHRDSLLFDNPGVNPSPRFTVLDCIDADLLADNESIFENVLMRMYKQFDDKVKESARSFERGMGYEHRTLSAKFEKVLKSYSKRNIAGVTYIQELVETSAKVDIRDTFATLVRDFLQFIHDEDGNGDTYLIIPVDDLDTNVKSAYKMMEEIHQYLMLNNIIVIVTMDLTQFSYICEKHFAGIVPTKSIIIEESKKSDLEQFWKKYVSVITQNYIDKILPSENRIHLPGIHNENRLVHLANFESEKGHSDNAFDNCPNNRCAYKEEKKPNRYGEHGCKTVKWVILYKIYRRTGIISDGLGKKKHYYEPDTIRKVVSLVDYLDQMKIVMQPPYIGQEKYKGPYYLLKANEPKLDDIEDILKVNINSIYKDIVERMEYEKLQPERREIFDDIRRQYRSRQHSEAFKRFQKEIIDTLSKYIVEHVSDKFMPLPSMRLQDEYNELYSAIGNLEYSYGNYQYLLNVYSNHIEKKMIHAILALQTTNMTSLYNSILLEKIRQQNAVNQGESDLEELFVDLRQIMGNSLSGNWFKLMLRAAILPGRIVTNDKNFYPKADDRLKIIKFFGPKNPNQEQLVRIEYFTVQLNLDFDKENDEDRRNLSSVIESIFILFPNADISVNITEVPVSSDPQKQIEEKSEITEESVTNASQEQAEGKSEITEEGVPSNPQEQKEEKIKIKENVVANGSQDQEKTKFKTNRIEITVQRRDANPDELGFIMWYFDTELSKRQIKDSLHVKHYAESSADSNNEEKENGGKVATLNLENQIKDLLFSYCPSCSEAPVPFYSQDFYYNLLKRLKENKDVHFGSLEYEFLKYYEAGLDDVISASTLIEFFYYNKMNPSEDAIDMIRYAIPYLKVLSRIDSLIKREDCFYNDDNYKHVIADEKDSNSKVDNQNDPNAKKQKKLIDLASNYRKCHYINNLICHKKDEKTDIWGMLNLVVIGFIIRLHYKD